MKGGVVKNQPDVTKRVHWIFALFLFFAVAILVRFGTLQLSGVHIGGARGAGALSGDEGGIARERGEIFLQDRFGVLTPLAMNKDFYTVTADSRHVTDKEHTARSLSEILTVPEDVVLSKLSKENDPYEILATKVTSEVADQIMKLAFDGIHLEVNRGRYYPYQSMASHVAGFLGMRASGPTGQYGLEGFYDDELEGGGGVAKLILSIDPNVQFKIEESLRGVIEKWEATGGSVIVMSPATGKILAMANYPDFNPNEYAKSEDPAVFISSSVSSQFELGSVFKPIVMAIGVNENVVTPETTYEDMGQVNISGYTIRNFDGKAHGVKTMTEVLESSLNTGLVFVQQKIPKEIMRTYIAQFGFGAKTDIDLQGEAKGDINNLRKDKDLEFATAAFGQGISITPMQMITAFSALANKGVLMRPAVVDKKVLRDGRESLLEPTAVRQVVTPETANALTKMLVSTVENGYDKAKINGYFVAGKTGTAEIADQATGKYFADETLHTFVGYAPAYHPLFSVLIKIDKPKGVRFASSSLAPVFSEMMSYLLTYYETPPDFK
ncbi:MAG: penicillin-binding protein 2 [Candidatus Azambacteria bacterium]|nr:penicillin-binding protein 2 [Candidatus Azambacteria bacterium]